MLPRLNQPTLAHNSINKNNMSLIKTNGGAKLYTKYTIIQYIIKRLPTNHKELKELKEL